MIYKTTRNNKPNAVRIAAVAAAATAAAIKFMNSLHCCCFTQAVVGWINSFCFIFFRFRFSFHRFDHHLTLCRSWVLCVVLRFFSFLFIIIVVSVSGTVVVLVVAVNFFLFFLLFIIFSCCWSSHFIIALFSSLRSFISCITQVRMHWKFCISFKTYVNWLKLFYSTCRQSLKDFSGRRNVGNAQKNKWKFKKKEWK